MRGLFVTATDTGVGKTVLASALAAAMVAAGERVRAHKPVLTGLDEPAGEGPGGPWPRDHELLARAAGMASEEVAPLRFGPATSPHLAAQLAGRPIERRLLAAAAQAALARLMRSASWRASAACSCRSATTTPSATSPASSRCPVVVAARPGLGTINHTLLTLRAARAAGLDVRAVVLTPWPGRPCGDRALEPRDDRAARGRAGVRRSRRCGVRSSPSSRARARSCPGARG